MALTRHPSFGNWMVLSADAPSAPMTRVVHLQNAGVVDKVATLLLCFTRQEPELNLHQIAEKTGLNKSTTCRILRRLALYHLIEQDPASSVYRLGIRLFELGSIVEDGLRLPEIGRPYLEELTNRTGETSHLAILEGGKIVHLVREESPHPVRVVPSRIGERYPFHCTAVGKAIAAYLPEEQRDPLLKGARMESFTSRTISRMGDLRKELDLIRQRGYAVDNEEFVTGIRCVGAPIQGFAGEVLGGVSVSGPSNRMQGDRIRAIARILLDTTQRISEYFSAGDGSAARSLRSGEARMTGRPRRRSRAG